MRVYDHTEPQGKRSDQRAFSLMMQIFLIVSFAFIAGVLLGALFINKIIELFNN